MNILADSCSECAADFRCAQAGCQVCQNALLAQYERFVYWVVRRQYRGQVEFVDAVQEGRIGLWQAILGYKAEVGCPFTVYASVAIRHRVWRIVKRTGEVERGLEDEERGDGLKEVVENWQAEQVCQAIHQAVSALPERLRQVISEAYGLDGEPPLSLAAIGRQLGLSRERIRQLHDQALALLRHPAWSLELRSLCERDSRQDYRVAGQKGRRGQK